MMNGQKEKSQSREVTNDTTSVSPPAISLPRGGGAIRGIGEKFAANPVTGTGSMVVPIATSPGRSGFGPQLALSYDSGSGNGPFGFGWSLSLPSITRRTDKGIPKYNDNEESDVFILSGAEDLVPTLRQDAEGHWVIESVLPRKVDGKTYSIKRYRPRIEGLFARIERWTNQSDPKDTFWRSISKNNITTWYGRTANSRIADPGDSTRIFSWLICETYDDKGNVILYEYKAEDSQDVDLSQVHERNRTDQTRSANRYLKRIKYGNRTPYFPRLEEDQPATPLPAEWLFEVVLDYGEHDQEVPLPAESGTWPVRSDPFSSYRASLEVRTYRLCQRALMFHHFPGEEGVGANCLVRSTDFTYSYEEDPANARNPIFSFLLSVTQTGYKRHKSGYLKKSLPPLEFEYSQPVVQEEIREVDAESLENLPSGLDGAQYQWVDLDGEGLSGILTEQGGSWYYKRNISPANIFKEKGAERTEAKFNPLEVVSVKPNIAMAGGRSLFIDLAGDGQLDLVDMKGSTPGFYERTPDEGWEPYRPFPSLPNLDWEDPNLKFVDLTGDGHADIIISKDEAFTWYPSIGEEGFETGEKVRKALDEEKGPRLIFADGTESIYLADLSGDGLTDLVRIRNGEVCYWPNLGYGRFGAKVTMDNAPCFDAPDQFSQERIRIADIDGTGVSDIIYLGRDGVRLYFNQSGNSWSRAYTLTAFPRIDNLSAVTTVDLLGNGTACLVWSSPLLSDAHRSMRYIDLMGGQKPHLLINSINNLGAETRVHYVPSTKFYVQDKLDGKPWITKIPFPVHVVERVETYDHISRNRFVTRYAYHHGYYDGIEREFRGFGMVEQWDTEAFEDYVVGVTQFEGDQELAPELYQPPVTTRTWFHTGVFFEKERLLHPFRNEYYLQKQHLLEPELPAELDADEVRECLQALKGLPLRIEIYSFDESAEEQRPFGIAENNYEIRLIQPHSGQRHAVFFPVGREAISLRYERNPSDPRIAHNFNLNVDLYGNVVKSASVVYGRKNTGTSVPLEVSLCQQRLYVTYTETDFTADMDQESARPVYRLRVPFETRSYEITGITPASDLFHSEEIATQIAGAAEIPYETVADAAKSQKRPLSQSRTLFLDNSQNPLSLGQWDTLALIHETYRLAFTPSVVSSYYGTKITDADFIAAGYRHFAGDTNWWIPSGTAIYPAHPDNHYYIPVGVKDPLGAETIATFDAYDLLIEKIQVQQAMWNEVIVTNDYRVLGPVTLRDQNKNRSAVEIDEMGIVVKSAVMGKEGSGEGDTLDDPTLRLEYNLLNWINNKKPNFVHMFAREKHGSANPRWQESYAYSNGSGGVAMVKAQANPGKALQVNVDGTVAEVDADPRWIGNGRIVLNNKGNPVKRYEPYFSITHEYEDEKALGELGVTPILYYDALGRNIRTLFPNGTFSKVEFNPWLQKVYDVNDTVKSSQWYADRGSPDPAGESEPLADPERRAAWLAAKHAGTPATLHFDSLGRPVYAISDYGNGKTASVRSEIDLTGRFSKVFDQEDREVSNGFRTMAGVEIFGETAEKGRRWTFTNVLGALVKTWDEHGREFRNGFDNLHRPVSTFVKEAGQPEILFTHIVYGDCHPNAEQLNLLGRVHMIFDQGGMARVPEVDFKGNPKTSGRILAKDYKNTLNWSAVAGQSDYGNIQMAANPLLETGEVFTANALYDALNRPTQVVLPDGSVFLPTYSEANFLSSLQVQVRGEGDWIEFLRGQDYDAKGQRQFAHYGNEIFTRYLYDPKTFRLTDLVTYKSGDDPEMDGLQNLHYTYDPVGNITQTQDDAQQTHYFNNTVVKPEALYEYDALYQLIRATGREHAGLTNDAIRNHSDLDFVPQLPHPNNADAVRTYKEEYEYDLLGNIKALRHRFKSQAGIGNGWTRHYHYIYEDESPNRTNRLSTTSLPGDPDTGPYSATYDYDPYGNMTKMPHLANMSWNFLDQLQRVDLGGGGTAYYVYGAGGQRIRKVIDRLGALQFEWIFLGPVRIFRRRRRNPDALELERWTVHISDNTGPIAQVDTKTLDENNSDPANPLDTPLVRYQHTNHLGSATIETDENGLIISYEEYHPYGTTAYRSAKPGFDLSLKRFRFSGKERDDETGLYYFGARYYAPWLGRWTSSDPGGLLSGFNLFRYASNNPVTFHDPTGMEDYSTIWAYNPRRLTREERAIVNNPESNPADVLRIFESYGYTLGGPLEWRNDFGSGGWVRTTPISPSATSEAHIPSAGTAADSEPIPGATGTGSPPPGSGTADEPTPAAPADAASAGTNGGSEEEPNPASDAASLTHSAPAAERFIWNHEFSGEGLPGTQRGRILETLYGTPWRSNTADWDVETATEVRQIKSTSSYDDIGGLTRSATRDAARAIADNPTGTMAGKSPRAVIVTPTDAPASAARGVRTALNPGRGRSIPTGAMPPEHVRGLPGRVGTAGRVLTGVGTALSAYALYDDIEREDAPMALGDALGVAGGGLELYAIAAPGATVLGASAMTVGLAVGGLGIAVTSGVSGYRAWERGDTAGAVAGGVGVAAGLAITAGAIGIAAGIAAAPVVLAVGIVAAIGVGIFHAGRYFDWW